GRDVDRDAGGRDLVGVQRDVGRYLDVEVDAARADAAVAVRDLAAVDRDLVAGPAGEGDGHPGVAQHEPIERDLDRGRGGVAAGIDGRDEAHVAELEPAPDHRARPGHGRERDRPGDGQVLVRGDRAERDRVAVVGAVDAVLERRVTGSGTGVVPDLGR